MKKMLFSAISSLMLLGVCMASSSVQASTTRQVHLPMTISIYGKHYMLQDGQEVAIAIPGVSASDFKMGSTLHFKNANSSNSMGSTIMTIHPLSASGCAYTNEGQVWETNSFGTTLISYYLGDYFCYSGGNVTSTSRYANSWYANSGLFWYYNKDQQFTTPTYHPDVTDSRTIHFTGPFWQQQNLVCAIDMHQDGSSNPRCSSYGGGI